AAVTDKRRVKQRKGAARHDAQRGGGGADALVLRLPLLLPHAGVEFAVAVLDKASRPVVVVNLPRLRRAGVLPRLKQPGVGLAEIVVVDAVDPRRHPLGDRPLADPFLAGAAAGRRGVVRNRLIAAERLMLLR